MDRYPDEQRMQAEHTMAMQAAAMAAQNILLAGARKSIGRMLDVRAAVLRGSRCGHAGLTRRLGSRRPSSRSDFLRTPASLIGDARSQKVTRYQDRRS
jgi:hypothetical protein